MAAKLDMRSMQNYFSKIGVAVLMEAIIKSSVFRNNSIKRLWGSKIAED
jgi:hypothetical protein